MRVFQGKSVSEGYAIGKIKYLEHGIAQVSRNVQGPIKEHALFEAAVVIAKGELEELECHVSDDNTKEILRFQRMLLDDESLTDVVRDSILSGAGSAESVERASMLMVQQLRQADDSYISERSADVEDVCRRLVAILDDKPRDSLKLTEPVIIAAESLFPSDIFMAGSGLILGIVTAEGSAQSHAALIAQTLGIPAIIKVGSAALADCDGCEAALNGSEGLLIREPDDVTRETIRTHRLQSELRTEKWHRILMAPCRTKDGTEFSLLGNCSGPEDIEQAIRLGASAIGLLRTEYSLSGDRIPGEEEQFYFYTACLSAAKGHTVVFRTYDIGLDKITDGVSVRPAANPALSQRGLRLFLQRRAMFRTQLCALLRAGARGPMHVMFPMVGSVEEWDEAMKVVEEAKKSLRLRNVAFNEEARFGCMIEIPSAALTADALAAHGCAFFSIGTNDLAQYTCAADRIDPSVEDYYNVDSPAVDMLVKMTVDAANRAGIPVSMSGASAGDPERVKRYMRMGLHDYSMVCRSFAKVKEALLETDLTE